MTRTVIQVLFILLFLYRPTYGWSENARPLVRLEDELTYGINPQQTEEVWNFLKNTFRQGFQSGEMRFRTVESVEQFKDTYFDTWNHYLISQWTGLRFRHRIGEGGKIKELIQFKLTPRHGEDVTATLRNEIKFIPALSLGSSGEFPPRALLTTYIKGGDRLRFIETMQKVGVNPEELRPLLMIEQERRRIYFRQGEKQFFTITLDIFKGKKFWNSAQLTQVEFEIGENLFTAATDTDRAKYLKVQNELFEIVAKKFALNKDQTPKVVQMYKLLSERGILAWLSFSLGEEAIVLIGVLLATLLYFIVARKKREECLYKPMLHKE